MKIPRKSHNHEAQPSRGTKGRRDEEQNPYSGALGGFVLCLWFFVGIAIFNCFDLTWLEQKLDVMSGAIYGEWHTLQGRSV